MGGVFGFFAVALMVVALTLIIVRHVSKVRTAAARTAADMEAMPVAEVVEARPVAESAFETPQQVAPFTSGYRTRTSAVVEAMLVEAMPVAEMPVAAYPEAMPPVEPPALPLAEMVEVLKRELVLTAPGLYVVDAACDQLGVDKGMPLMQKATQCWRQVGGGSR